MPSSTSQVETTDLTDVSASSSGTPANARLVYLSRFASRTNNIPASEGWASWDDFAARMVDPRSRIITDDKMRVQLLSFARFDGTRSNKNTRDITAAAMDFDDGKTTLDTILQCVPEVEFIAYSTHSHSVEKTKMRVILPLSRPVTKDEWQLLWPIINALLGGGADKSTKDPCRMSFLPSCPDDKRNLAFQHHNKGQFLDPDELLSTSPTPSPQTPDDLGVNILGGLNGNERNYPPSYAAFAAKKCNQLRHTRDTKGKDAVEPEWFATLCFLAHCADGQDLYQDWSSGHPGYAPEATEKKFNHALADSPGATKCERFKELNPKGCEGCPYFGKITSPIQLGHKEDAQNNLPPDLDALVRELAALPPHQYDLRRKAEAEKLGIRISTLDALVGKARSPIVDEDNRSGRPLSLPPTEPWHDPVDGAKTLDSIVSLLRRFVILPEGAAEAIALWIEHTHVFEASVQTPRLFISSPIVPYWGWLTH